MPKNSLSGRTSRFFRKKNPFARIYLFHLRMRDRGGFSTVKIRVDYGRRRVSQPPVSRSPSPNRTYTFRYVSGSPETPAYLSYTTESVSRHVGDRTITALALCPQSIPPASKHLGLLPPFATWTAFPSSDYYEGSAPHPSFPGLHG